MVEFVVNDAMVQEVMPARERIVEVLESVGFDAERQALPVASLSGAWGWGLGRGGAGAAVGRAAACRQSLAPAACPRRPLSPRSPLPRPAGGWKMKLALARAMLMNADIMLLDEPTNHLDVTNVAWLVSYLTGLKGVTSVVVSHDSGFLDAVCSSIIHYEDNFKLKKYLGNLSKFVQQRPEAAAYYNLADATTKWALPEPGYLEVSGRRGAGWREAGRGERASRRRRRRLPCRAAAASPPPLAAPRPPTAAPPLAPPPCLPPHRA